MLYTADTTRISQRECVRMSMYECVRACAHTSHIPYILIHSLVTIYPCKLVLVNFERTPSTVLLFVVLEWNAAAVYNKLAFSGLNIYRSLEGV